jgi:hypothetical protein
LKSNENVYISKYKPGEIFGEWETMFSQKRATTLVSITNSFMVVMRGDVFKNNVGEHLLNKHWGDLEFLQDCELFQGWTESSIGCILQHFTKEAYPKNTKIYDVGDSNSY